MTAVDTNILVRIIVGDDKNQASRAAVFLRSQEHVLIAKTVLLELGWVLAGSRYALDRVRIVAMIRALLTADNVEVEDAAAVNQALDWCERGMDFADSLHLASAGSQQTFATFDKDLAKQARRMGVSGVEAI